LDARGRRRSAEQVEDRLAERTEPAGERTQRAHERGTGGGQRTRRRQQPGEPAQWTDHCGRFGPGRLYRGRERLDLVPRLGRQGRVQRYPREPLAQFADGLPGRLDRDGDVLPAVVVLVARDVVDDPAGLVAEDPSPPPLPERSGRSGQRIDHRA